MKSEECHYTIVKDIAIFVIILMAETTNYLLHVCEMLAGVFRSLFETISEKLNGLEQMNQPQDLLFRPTVLLGTAFPFQDLNNDLCAMYTIE